MSETLNANELRALADLMVNISTLSSGYFSNTTADVVEAKVKVGDKYVYIGYDEAGDLTLLKL